MSIFARTMRRHASFHLAGSPPAPPVNQGPTGVSFANSTTSLPEDTDTTSAIKLADVVVTDDGLGTNTLSISGDSRFALVGSELFLVAGASLDYETATSHSCTVTATDDQGAGSAQATFTLTITDVFEATVPDAPTGVAVTVVDNEGPTAITLNNQTTSLAEDADTTSRIHLADITLADDGMGTNVITVDNPSYFEIYQGSLYLVAGASLDYETATSHSCTISAVDSTTNDAAVTQAFTLTVTDVFELTAPDAPTGVAVTVSEDPTPTTDPYWQETVLLLQESLADESSFGQTLVNNGSVSLTSANAKTGTYGLDFSGGARWLEGTVDSTLNMDSDCTIEAWIKTSTQANQRIFQYRRSSNSATDLCSLHTNSGTLVWRIGSYLIQGTTNIHDGNWHHIAGVRTSTSLDIYVDGLLEGTTSIPSTYALSAVGLPFTIGRDRFYATDYFDGQLDNFRFSRVARYTSAFTPPTASFPTAEPVDEFFSDTVLLIQEDLADDSYQGQTVTASGTAAISTTSKVGNYSVHFPAAGDRLTVADDFSELHSKASDYTIEFWFQAASTSGRICLLETAAASASSGILLEIDNGAIDFSVYRGVLGSFTTLSGGSVSANTWHHVAVSATTSAITLYLDGKQVATTAWSLAGSGSASQTNLTIGADTISVVGDLNGYIDSLRITVGHARYTTAFTPSDEPLPRTNGDPDFASVDLLLQDSLVDQSLSGQTVVASGNAALSTAQVKYGTQSIYFDGNGDYLTTSALPLGTADYTLESWLYIDTLTYQPFLFTGIPHNQSGSHLWVCLNLGGGYGITVGYTGGGPGGQIRSTTTPAAGQWYHLAVVRNGGVTTIYLDGSSIASGSQHNGITLANSQPEIGNESNNNRGLNGFVDSFRLTAGVARYTANFTPPTQEFPN